MAVISPMKDFSRQLAIVRPLLLTSASPELR
jgi:hypothetical protein